MSDFEETSEIESLVDRLSAEFPAVPERIVHQVVDAAWAEVAHNPVRGAGPNLAELAAKDSLERYPTPPSAPVRSGDDGHQ